MLKTTIIPIVMTTSAVILKETIKILENQKLRIKWEKVIKDVLIKEIDMLIKINNKNNIHKVDIHDLIKIIRRIKLM